MDQSNIRAIGRHRHRSLRRSRPHPLCPRGGTKTHRIQRYSVTGTAVGGSLRNSCCSRYNRRLRIHSRQRLVSTHCDFSTTLHFCPVGFQSRPRRREHLKSVRPSTRACGCGTGPSGCSRSGPSSSSLRCTSQETSGPLSSCEEELRGVEPRGAEGIERKVTWTISSKSSTRPAWMAGAPRAGPPHLAVLSVQGRRQPSGAPMTCAVGAKSSPSAWPRRGRRKL